MISVENVSKRFGQQIVLDGVSLRIGESGCLAVVGPSGVGKSVLLKLIMGILQPDGGEVKIDGHSITAAKTEIQRNKIRSSMGVLFQSAALLDSLTVQENVAFPLLEGGKMNKLEVYDRAAAMLESLSLQRYAQRYPQEISMGIRKRVGIARALIRKPKIFLFDEPNTGLDPFDGQEVYDLIDDCRRKWSFAGVVISHEIPEVFQVANRVALLLGGKVAAQGTPLEIAASLDPAVQQFLEGRTDGPIRMQ